MTLSYLSLFKLSKNISAATAEDLLNRMILDLCQQKKYDVKKRQTPIANYTIAVHGSVSIFLLESIHVIDPLLNNADDLVVTHALYNAYLEREEKNFKHSPYVVDQARIWPKFHHYAGKYYVFARFGYIRDRIGRAPEKQGYRLEFTNELLGSGRLSTVESTVTEISNDESMWLDDANHKRCVKNAELTHCVEDPFAEIKILQKMPYEEYKSKAAILFKNKKGKNQLIIPQKHQSGQTLNQFMDKTTKLVLSDIFDIVVSYLKKLAAFHQFALHRDIKSNNIMVFLDENNNLETRLIDFGLSVLKTEAFSSSYKVGIKACWAPEVHGPLTVYSKQSDLYAAIITMLDLLRLLKQSSIQALMAQTGSLEAHQVCLTLIVKEMETAITYMSLQSKKLLINLVKDGLAFEAQSRPSVDEVIQRLTVIQQMIKPNYTEDVANQLAEKLATSPIFASIRLIREALEKVVPHHFSKFKSVLNLNCLRFCESIESVNRFLTELEMNLPKTDSIIFSVKTALNAAIQTINQEMMTPPKMALCDCLYQQIIDLTNYQKYQPQKIDEWHAWHEYTKHQFGEESVIYPIIRWLINRFILEKNVHHLFFAPYAITSKEVIYPILTTLCSQQTMIDKLLAVNQLLRMLAPFEIPLLLAELKMPPEAASLVNWINQKINDFQPLATVVHAPQSKS